MTLRLTDGKLTAVAFDSVDGGSDTGPTLSVTHQQFNVINTQEIVDSRDSNQILLNEKDQQQGQSAIYDCPIID